jgi:hypothetical protein
VPRSTKPSLEPGDSSSVEHTNAASGLIFHPKDTSADTYGSGLVRSRKRTLVCPRLSSLLTPAHKPPTDAKLRVAWGRESSTSELRSRSTMSNFACDPRRQRTHRSGPSPRRAEPWRDPTAHSFVSESHDPLPSRVRSQSAGIALGRWCTGFAYGNFASGRPGRPGGAVGWLSEGVNGLV